MTFSHDCSRRAFDSLSLLGKIKPNPNRTIKPRLLHHGGFLLSCCFTIWVTSRSKLRSGLHSYPPPFHCFHWELMQVWGRFACYLNIWGGAYLFYQSSQCPWLVPRYPSVFLMGPPFEDFGGDSVVSIPDFGSLAPMATFHKTLALCVVSVYVLSFINSPKPLARTWGPSGFSCCFTLGLESQDAGFQHKCSVLTVDMDCLQILTIINLASFGRLGHVFLYAHTDLGIICKSIGEIMFKCHKIILQCFPK